MSEWRIVEGFPNYRVSDAGDIESLRRGQWRPLVGWRTKWGHHKVCLRAGTWQTRRAYVHALVLEAFVGPCPAGCESCHYDGNPSNNALSNLRWDTHAENMRDSMRHGTKRGDRNGHARLTPEQVAEIRRRRASGEILRTIAESTGCTLANVWAVCNTTWRDVA